MKVESQRPSQAKSSEADFTFVEPEIDLSCGLNERASIGLERPETVVDDVKHHSCSEHHRAIIHGRWLYRNLRQPNGKDEYNDEVYTCESIDSNPESARYSPRAPDQLPFAVRQIHQTFIIFRGRYFR